jgi:hypothetical protein
MLSSLTVPKVSANNTKDIVELACELEQELHKQQELIILMQKLGNVVPDLTIPDEFHNLFNIKIQAL